jgi:hypothetical protein
MTHTQLVLLEIVKFIGVFLSIAFVVVVLLGVALALGELHDRMLWRQFKAEERLRAERAAKFWAASLAPRSF